MDEADQASAYQESMNAEARARRKPEASVEATGRCNYCGRPIEPPRRFCGPACSISWENSQCRT